jgi:hypothetical protein
MKKQILAILAVLLLALTACGGKGSSSSKAQAVASDALPKTSPSAASKKLPALNKTASSEKIAFSIRIPSEWDFSIWFEDMDNEYYLVIDPIIDSTIDGLNIFMSVHQNIELSNAHYSHDEDFVFADGGKGFCRKSDVHTAFVNVTENGTLTYLINHGGYEGGSEWYFRNEELIYEVAKTLTFTGTLVLSSFGDFAIYVLPAFEYIEDGVIRIIAPRADLQSQFLSDNMMFIYAVKEGSPVSEPSEEYRKHDGVTIRSEFAHYKIGENTFEVQFMFPQATIEDGLTMMRAMANSMRAVE